MLSNARGYLRVPLLKAFVHGALIDGPIVGEDLDLKDRSDVSVQWK